MPTYTKSVAATAPAYQPKAQEGAVAWNIVAVTAAELTLNAVIPLVRLPRGAVVHDVVVTVTDLDTSTGGVCSVGVSGDAARYIQAGSIAAAGTLRAGNNATSSATWAAATAFTSETTVDMTITTAPGAAAAGTIKVAVTYTVE